MEVDLNKTLSLTLYISNPISTTEMFRSSVKHLLSKHGKALEGSGLEEEDDDQEDEETLDVKYKERFEKAGRRGTLEKYVMNTLNETREEEEKEKKDMKRKSRNRTVANHNKILHGLDDLIQVHQLREAQNAKGRKVLVTEGQVEERYSPRQVTGGIDRPAHLQEERKKQRQKRIEKRHQVVERGKSKHKLEQQGVPHRGHEVDKAERERGSARREKMDGPFIPSDDLPHTAISKSRAHHHPNSTPQPQEEMEHERLFYRVNNSVPMHKYHVPSSLRPASPPLRASPIPSHSRDSSSPLGKPPSGRKSKVTPF